MTVELWMLLISVGVLMAGAVFQGIVGLIAYGPVRQAGARDEKREPGRVEGRAARAMQNQLESLAMFTPVVLAAHLADVHSAMTVMGAQIYALARVAYMPAYWMGIPFVRTVIFTAGLVGTILIAGAVISAS